MRHTETTQPLKTNSPVYRALLWLLIPWATATAGTCQNQTPLTQAVIKDDVRQVKQLLVQGEEINQTNKFGFTPLMVAVSRGNKDMVDALLAEGADANFRGVAGLTPLYLASLHDTPIVLKALINARANINNREDNGFTPVIGAALRGKLENLQILQSAGAAFTNDLVYSSALGQLDLVEKRLKEGADANAKNESGRTPLAAAAANGHLAVVNFLVEHGADVNSEGKDGDVTKTALIFAAQEGHTEIIKALLNKKAGLKADSSGQTALFKAVNGGYLAVVKCLLDNGADPNGQNPDGEPVLFTAAQKHAEILKPLLDSGADVNATNKLGSTALIMAAYYGNAESVLALLSKGARMSMKTTQGFTALQLANRLRDREQIIEILSDPEAATKNIADFQAGKPKMPIDSKVMTKTAWRAKIRSYWNPGGGMKVTTIANFKAMFGEPSKTQTVEGHAYWYYDCSDGMIQIDLIDPNMSGGRFLINAVNDF